MYTIFPMLYELKGLFEMKSKASYQNLLSQASEMAKQVKALQHKLGNLS